MARKLMPKWAVKTVALAIAPAAALFLGNYLKTQIFSGPDEESLARDAERLNRTLPEMVSEGIRLDKTSAGPGNSFTYIYTVVDDPMAESIPGSGGRLNELRLQLHERVCTMMPEYAENGTVVNYLLKDNSGAILARISVDPKDCRRTGENGGSNFEFPTGRLESAMPEQPILGT